MPITYDLKTDLRYQQGVEQGIEQGIKQGIEIGVISLLEDSLLSPEQIAHSFKVPLAYVLDIKTKLVNGFYKKNERPAIKPKNRKR